jgi:hypothetical protein
MTLAYEAKPNTGSLWKNDNRTQDTHAHARGSALIDGVEYFVDAWTNIDKKGDRYQALKFKRKDKQPSVAPDRRAEPKREQGMYDRDDPRTTRRDDDNDLPF